MTIRMRQRGSGTDRASTRTSRAFTFVGLIASLSLVAFGLVSAFAGPANAAAKTADNPQFVAVCHYVPGEGNTHAGWTFIASMNWNGWVNGHANQHPQDKWVPVGSSVGDCGDAPVICTDTPNDPSCTPPPAEDKFVAVCHYVPGQGNTPPNWTFIASMNWNGWLSGHSGHDNDKWFPVGATSADCGTPPPPVCTLPEVLNPDTNTCYTPQEERFVAVCHYVPGQGNTPPNWTFIDSISWNGWINGHSSHDNDKWLPLGSTSADCGTPPPPVCTLPQVLNPETNTCYTPPVVCTLPEVLNPQTNTCYTPPVVCTLPEVLNPQTNTCYTPPVVCTAPQVLDPTTNTCYTPGTPSNPDNPSNPPTTNTVTPVSEPVPAVVAEPVVQPAVVEPAVVEPVVVPEAGTVPQAQPGKTPAEVSVPQEAAVPTAVNAGGGSSAPAPGLPMWALALVIAGVLGAAGAGSRLLATSRK